MSSILQFFSKLRCHGFKPVLVKRAIVMSLVVGTILVAINHGAVICKGKVCWFTLSQILLTMLIPYTVSTLSSVLAINENAVD